MNYLDYLDENKWKDLERFAHYVNQRTEFQYGLRSNYDAPKNDPALGIDVEYFGFVISQDDRMRYIMENIVTIPDVELSPRNKICNTIISHFYGVRGIHSLVTGINDPKRAHVDFEAIVSGDVVYKKHLRELSNAAKAANKKFYGTTELHTSLMTSSRNFYRQAYNLPNEPSHPYHMLEWVASFLTSGLVDDVLTSLTLKQTFELLTSLDGVGEYYGYHCSTSNSVNPALAFNHDERFCVPGPGARETLEYLFEPLKQKIGKQKLPYGELVCAIRDDQKTLFKKPLVIHPFFHNFIGSSGKNVFSEAQDELKVYTSEVMCCQFGVYRRLRYNPELISRRKVAREEVEAKSCALLEF